MLWTLFTDGASRGNPGEAGVGAYLIAPDGQEIFLKKYLGHKTNNQAEYEALILGLEELKREKACEVLVKADSELMIRQMNGIYKVKNENIIPLFFKAKELVGFFKKIRFVHVPRAENKVADLLANQAIDERADH